LATPLVERDLTVGNVCRPGEIDCPISTQNDLNPDPFQKNWPTKLAG
jgi:hypothetical protein